MPLYLQRLRVSVRTKNQRFAGTNSSAKLWYTIDDDHRHPILEPGDYSLALDHPFHDDFQRGAIDSYELNLAEGSSGIQKDGVAIPNGLTLRDFDHARQMKFRLVIEGSDLWTFDRLTLAGYFKELKPSPENSGDSEVHDLGWLEMGRLNQENAMSTNPTEGTAELPIELNGSFS